MDKKKIVDFVEKIESAVEKKGFNNYEKFVMALLFQDRTKNDFLNELEEVNEDDLEDDLGDEDEAEEEQPEPEVEPQPEIELEEEELPPEPEVEEEDDLGVELPKPVLKVKKRIPLLKRPKIQIKR